MGSAARIAVVVDANAGRARDAGEVLQNVVDLEGFFSPMAIPNVRFLELARRIEFREAGVRRRPAVPPEVAETA